MTRPSRSSFLALAMGLALCGPCGPAAFSSALSLRGQVGDVLPAQPSMSADEVAFPDNSSVQQDVIANLYILQHGQSLWFEQLIESRKMPNLFSIPRDGQLSQNGTRQAALAKKFFSEQLGLLHGVPADKVQLASSLANRAYDTTVIATEPLWAAWAKSNPSFEMQEIPAAMECSNLPFDNRRLGVHDDDPVRWEDSILAGTYSQLADIDVSLAKSLFYRTVAEGMLPSSPTTATVLTAYPRDRAHNCDKQLEYLVRYLVETARAGKEHIILGAHDQIIKKFFGQCYDGRPPASPSASPVRGFWSSFTAANGIRLMPAKEGLPNGALLHMLLRVTPENKILITPQQPGFYPNPIVTD